MNRPRLVIALTIPFSFVAGHMVGFALGHQNSVDRAVAEAGHEYLASLSSAAVPLLLLSMAFAVWAGARRTPFRPRYSAAAGLYVGVFATIEVIEHLAEGWSLGHLLGEPALWLGLLTQLIVAAVVVVILRALVRVGEELAETPARVLGRLLTTVHGVTVCVVRGVALTSIRRRGPPQPIRT